MKGLLSRYQNILLILLLLFVASMMLADNAKDKDKTNFMERFALTLTSPVNSTITFSVRKVLSVWNNYIYLINTSEKNTVLKKQLIEERFKHGLLLEELKKYRRVDGLLSYHPIAKEKFLVADVIGWDSTNLSQTAIINKGTKDGVGEQTVVITHEGLIGRVVSSSGHSSRVLMMTDSRSAVDAYVQGSRARCIVVGQNKGKCVIDYLSIDSKAQVGDKLISSGLGGIFPKGLTLGTISSIEPDSGRLFFKAEMIPSANFKQVEEVLVMLGTMSKNKIDLPEENR